MSQVDSEFETDCSDPFTIVPVVKQGPGILIHLAAILGSLLPHPGDYKKQDGRWVDEAQRKVNHSILLLLW